jgi:hypothetical protein
MASVLSTIFGSNILKHELIFNRGGIGSVCLRLFRTLVNAPRSAHRIPVLRARVPIAFTHQLQVRIHRRSRPMDTLRTQRLFIQGASAVQIPRSIKHTSAVRITPKPRQDMELHQHVRHQAPQRFIPMNFPSRIKTYFHSTRRDLLDKARTWTAVDLRLPNFLRRILSRSTS